MISLLKFIQIKKRSGVPGITHYLITGIFSPTHKAVDARGFVNLLIFVFISSFNIGLAWVRSYFVYYHNRVSFSLFADEHKLGEEVQTSINDRNPYINHVNWLFSTEGAYII